MDNIDSKAKLVDTHPLVKYYMEQLSLNELFEKYIPKTDKMDIAPAEALKMTVFNIINAPAPLYRVSEWLTGYLDGMGEDPQKAGKFNDDCLGRNLDRLYKADRKQLMLELSAKAIQVHQLETDIVHNDSTTVTFKGRYENQPPDAVQLNYGHNKDFRPDCLQLVLGLNVTEDGHIPLSFKLFDGNQSDDTTHIANWEELRAMLGKTDFIYVADCKLCSEKNLDYIDLRNGRFITVVPKNRSLLKPFKELLENGEVRWNFAYNVPNNRKPSAQHSFYTFESDLTEKGYRLIWVLSAAKAQQDQKTRERRLDKAEEELGAIAEKLNRYHLKTRSQIETAIDKAPGNEKGLIDINLSEQTTHYKKKVGAGRPGPDSIYEECAETRYELDWSGNQEEIDKKALADGTFPLITDTELKCVEVLQTYKQQPGLEKRFNTTKSILEIAPVFVEKSSRIEAMTFLYFVALMVISLIERCIRKQMAEESIETISILPEKKKTKKPTWNNLRYFFRDVHLSQIFVNDHLVKQTLKGLSELHLQVLRLLRVPPSVYLKFNREVER